MKYLILMAVYLSVIAVSCKKNDTTSTVDIEETAQQVGDVMASLDEGGGSSSGSLAIYNKTFERYDINNKTIIDYFLEPAYAVACSGSGSAYSACTNNVITRTFSDCTIGLGATLSGTVTLTWTDAAVNSTCQMAGSGHSIVRNPNFTITGRRGATLTVSKSGTNGQKVEYVSAGNFNLTNDGVRRVFTAAGSTLFDYTTQIQTGSAIGVTGTTRAGRVMTGGEVVVTNNLTSEVCTYAPNAVTWPSDGSCNCATSGSWSGSCINGSSTSTTTLTITGCGTATFTKNGESQSVNFDRCAAE